jgi:putative tricarboxylic transport membrane protein
MAAKVAKVKKSDLVAGAIMALFSIAYLVGGLQIPQPAYKQQVGPSVFPLAVGALMLLLSVIYIIQQILGKIKEDAARAEMIGAEEKVETKADLKTMGIMLLIMFAYALLFEPLGYPITTFLTFVAGALVLDRKHMVRDTIIAFIAGFGLYAVFAYLLRVNLPPGPLSLIGI